MGLPDQPALSAEQLHDNDRVECHRRFPGTNGFRQQVRTGVVCSGGGRGGVTFEGDFFEREESTLFAPHTPSGPTSISLWHPPPLPLHVPCSPRICPSAPSALSGLMVARWPWSGHYEVLAPIWATAHTTQFTRAGWSYLLNNTGGGSLAFGGSYVTIVDASAPPSTPTWSIVIEKMCSSNYPVCNVEEASFCLGGSLAGNGSGNLTLALWQSVFLGGDGSNDTYLSNLGNLSVSASSPCFSVLVPANTMMTVTTTGWGGKGQHATPPPLAPFPLQYADDFSSCSPPSSARYFSDITGEFECAPSAASRSGLVMRQMTPAPPVSWEHDFRPHGVIGNATWTNVNATFVAIFPAAAPSPTTLMVAVRAGFLNATNYNALLAEEASPGLWFTLASDGGWNLTSSIVNATEAAGLILKGTSPVPVQPLTPIAISLVAVGDLLHASIGGAVAIDGLDVSNFQYSGFVGYGCILYGSCADFASISIDATV